MAFRPSQWWSFLVADAVGYVKALLPAFKQWAFYGFRRILLFYTVKHAIDTFWLFFKNRKLRVSYARELSLMSWVPSNCNYAWNAEMRVFIRKCGHHCSPAALATGKHIEPWFYADVGDNTRKILEQMEAKALRVEHHDKISQAEEMKAVMRVLRNFKDFKADEVMVFFKASELMDMKEGQVIFGAEDVEQYFYGVIQGEINLYAEGIGNRGIELLKVAGSDECIVSISAFIYYYAIQPQTFGELKLHATCGKTGQYYRIPISELVKYIGNDRKKMYEIFNTILIRQQKFLNGLNDLTGILPRLHKQSYLDAHYTPIDLDPGVIEFNSDIANQAFQGLHSIFEMDAEDKRLCWVGVLDTKTVLLRRFKKAQYAFYVHEGLVACTVSKLRRSYNAIQFYLAAGEVIGWREAVVGLNMDVQYQVADGAKALVVAVPDFVARRYFEKSPEMCLHLVTKLFSRFSLIYRQLDYAVRFTHKRENEVVYKKTDDDLGGVLYAYLLLSGRLRFLTNPEEFRTPGASARYGILEKGDWFGMVAMYTDSPHLHRTIICDRYAQIGILPRYVISLITSTFREAGGYQVDYMARCIHRDHEHTFLDTDKMQDSRFQVDSVGVHTWRTFRMVCVYAASPDIPAKLYCDELARHHTSEANVVTREEARKALDITEFNSDNEYLLAKWLVLQEENCTVLFVIAENDFSDLWNATVAKICDMLQVVVMQNISHQPDEKEMRILEKATKARKELVFIHPVIRVSKPQVGPGRFPHLPQGSILWLRPRPWVQRHHHVRMLDSAIRFAKNKNPEDLNKYLKDTRDPDKHSDFGRVIRWISGQSVGLVLGGGGAKGAAHLGSMEYLLELGVPIDYIAGVSIGSFLGALYAMYENISIVEDKAKELWEQLKRPERFLRDVSPFLYSSVFRGHAFSAALMHFFGTLQIEDLYIPYFCVSTDLRDSRARTHMSGDLWFYTRASMTLTLLFPPQINQFDTHLLMDGGYSDLVPAMAMRRLGIKYLIAINIGDEGSLHTFNIGYHVSGLHCILQNLLPYSTDRIPFNLQIWDSLLNCSARNFIQILKAMDDYCIYIRPNINAYTALDFKNYTELRNAGYLSTKVITGDETKHSP